MQVPPQPPSTPFFGNLSALLCCDSSSSHFISPFTSRSEMNGKVRNYKTEANFQTTEQRLFTSFYNVALRAVRVSLDLLLPLASKSQAKTPCNSGLLSFCHQEPIYQHAPPPCRAPPCHLDHCSHLSPLLPASALVPTVYPQYSCQVDPVTTRAKSCCFCAHCPPVSSSHTQGTSQRPCLSPPPLPSPL